jgi:hypothetical protein
MEKKSLGHMYQAFMPCGKLVALAWDDQMDRNEVDALVREWQARGNTVKYVQRFEGDEFPEKVCDASQPCKCRDQGLRG